MVFSSGVVGTIIGKRGAPCPLAAERLSLYYIIMTKITASDLPSSDSISPACAKYYSPLSKKKKKQIDMDAIGTPSYNLLLDLMKCQVKHPNIKKNISSGSDGSGSNAADKVCAKVEKNYSACHAGVMGVGNFKGRRNCGEEMEKLYQCVNPGATLP